MLTKKYARVTGLLLAITLIATLLFVPVLAAAEETTHHHSVSWFDDNGNEITDTQLIDKLENAAHISARGYVCCKNQQLEYYNREEHMYQMPLPSFCLYYRYRMTYCAGCDLILSDVKTGQFTHTHT